jgi:hypothetical protein
MSALTSIRTRLTENPQGLTRDEIYAKVHFEAPKDIALALNQLKQADQIIEQDGRYFLKGMQVPGGVVPAKTSHLPASKVLQKPKTEKKTEIFPIEKSHLSTAARVTNYLRDEAGKDAERWIPVTEINRICSDGTKQGNQRVSVALSTLKGQSKIEPKETERGFYRWKSAEKTGQVRVPVLDVLKEEAPTVEVEQETIDIPDPLPQANEALAAPETVAASRPAGEEPEMSKILFLPMQIPSQFVIHLREQEVEATQDFIAKCQLMIRTWSDEDRVACAHAAGRMEAVQALVEKLQAMEPA